MTMVATTLRTAYLAGPMRGHPDLNFPEFHRQAAWLRSQGWTVFSPAERDEADPVLNGDFSVGQERGLDYYMQFDLAAVAQADTVIAMEGWEGSQGARLEMVTAVELGHPVFVIETKRFTGRRMLRSVDPLYVQTTFYMGGVRTDEAAEVTIIEDEVHTMSEETLRAFRFLVPDVEERQGVSLVFTTVDMDPPEDLGFQQGIVTDAGEFDPPVLRMPREHVTDGECWCGEAATDFDPSLGEARKAMPIATGVLDYFPAALLEVAKVSKAGNDKHNPGQPLHHARGKSMNHADSLLRHLIDRGGVDEETGMLHSAEMAWRALALLQQELEDAGAPLARGAVLPES